jgi:hypothetical protein
VSGPLDRDGDKRRLSLPAVSAALVLIQLALAGLHLFPTLVFSDSPQLSVLVFINGLGPYWVLSFGTTGAVLTIALWRCRFRHFAHLGCAFVWVVYSTALWIGSLAVDPPAPVRLAVICTGLAFVHTVAATAYADEPGEGI